MMTSKFQPTNMCTKKSKKMDRIPKAKPIAPPHVDVQRERDVNEMNSREEPEGTKCERLCGADDGRGRARGTD